MKIGIVAGEASGDLLGANLIAYLRTLSPELTVTGIGGPLMIEQGCNSLFPMQRLSVMGLIEPLKHLPELFHIRKTLREHFLAERPDVFIGIDSPDFNLGLEIPLRAAGIPVVHYVSPSVWAWRKRRIHKIAKAVDLMMTLFPFEAAFYQAEKVPVKFVGHPLADIIPLHIDKQAARARLGLEENATYIAVLPGSRRNELKYLAAIFAETMKCCLHESPQLKFVSSSGNQELFQSFVNDCKGLPIQFFAGQSHDVMAAADVILVTSGTATLEAMLFKRPMVIAYRMANVTYQLARFLVKIPFFGLPNLLANQLLVPEFIQSTATPENLARALMDFLQHPEKIAILEEKFTKIHQQLKCGASEQAAHAVMSVIKP